MGWPRGVPHHRTLTAGDLAQIAGADPSTPTTQLAADLGKPYFTVAHARQVMRRRGGWLTLISVVPCTECGQGASFLTHRVFGLVRGRFS